MGTSVDVIDPVNMNMLLERMDLLKRLVANGTIIGKEGRGMNFHMAC